jgi:hypothetical protein
LASTSVAESSDARRRHRCSGFRRCRLGICGSPGKKVSTY